MSTDEVLASSLWPWPDPLLKRDRSGLVLFVNAAFLQLYGGQVQDWCGKPLAGWPAPVNVGAQRFETRIGAAPNENVYDWVESTMADGNALAIARNVTIFMTVPEPHVAEIAPSMPEVPTRKHVEELPHQAQVQVQAQAQTAISVPPTPEPVQIQPAAPVAPPPVAPSVSPAPELAAEVVDTLNKRADEYADLDNKAEHATPQSAVTAPPVADQISQEIHTSVASLEPLAVSETEPQENTRMMERRALPIEDSTNVLGSNWRDEVIAKAIGSTSTPEETTTTDTSEEGASPNHVAGLQILLAEDNAINALLTRTLLEAEGAEVDTVEDGALALEAVSKKKYDLIFMDMRMPNMDGLESTRKIRAFGFDRPIIALTANAFDDDRNACFDSGMNDFMTKPVSAEELSEMVRNWTEPEAERKLAS